MKKSLLLAMAMLFSGAALSGTDHYLLRDGNHIQHLKIVKINDEVTVSADVDFEPNANEEGKYACSTDVSGPAKQVADNELVMKKHSESSAKYCELKIKLTATGAVVEQSEGCGDFAAGLCHFSTDGKEMVKFK
jgi:hypothetical protein